MIHPVPYITLINRTCGTCRRVSALLFVVLIACSPSRDGESLAKRHCSACHLFPDPRMLPKSKWEKGVLPEMAFRMGLDVSRFPGGDAREVNEIMKAMPSRPMVSENEWQAIRQYYLASAPDSLPPMQEGPVFPLTTFSASAIRLPINGQNMITVVRWDSLSKKIFLGTRKNTLYQLGPMLDLQDSIQLASPPSDIIFQPAGNSLISCMGIMDPNDQAVGTIVQLDPAARTSRILIDSLKRPVDLEIADLNNDDEKEFIISAFGNFTGNTSLHEKTGRDRFVMHMLHNFPGTRKTVVNDMNRDGLPDILALITQGDEQIALFTNRGNLRFSYQVLLKFPSVYGSSYFDLCDFNRDGHPDIIYTNGDNADYSYTLKPYHGVRVFVNDGRNAFKESDFFAMHGASMAKARDYDGDGDLDVAAISFFPDFKKHPERGFIYLENREGKLIPHVTPLAASGRWITMESADIDSDGDEDILLGALDFPTSVPEDLLRRWGKERTTVLVLRNNLK